MRSAALPFSAQARALTRLHAPPRSTTDFCVGGTCQHVFNTKPCDDLNECTSNDVCSAGVCAGTFSCVATDEWLALEQPKGARCTG